MAYTAPAVIVDTILQGLTELPKDQFVNRMHFLSVNPVAPAAVAYTAMTKLCDFFTYPSSPATGAIEYYLSNGLSPTVVMKAYDLAAAEPRPELVVGHFTVGLTGGDPIPEEVALVISWICGRNAPKYRGRNYIGPLGQVSLGTDSSGMSAPTGTFVAALAAAGARMVTAGGVSGASSEITLTTGTTTALDAGTAMCILSARDVATRAITGGWVDNEWDGQRRRRVEATSRTTFS